MSEATLRRVTIFVSSPGDVGPERQKSHEIFERLQVEFSGRLAIVPYYWEHEPMSAHSDYQSQIEPPSHYDLFVCILWARLGTRLHPELHRKPDGTAYDSGTEWEILDALRSFERSKAPEMMIYRRTTDPLIPAEPEGAGEKVLQQYRALKSFIDRLTKREESFVAAVNSYNGLDDFEETFETKMRKKLQRFVPAGVAETRIVTKTWRQGSPFRGLRHFEFEHAPVFFGRTRDINNVLEALRHQAARSCAFVLVFGGSGVGKSSLVRAGVLPLLVTPGVIEGVGLWRRVILRPGETTDGDLFDTLAQALLGDDALPELRADGTTVQELAQTLRSKPEAAGGLIKGVLSRVAHQAQVEQSLQNQPRALCALLVDQLEELFTVKRLAEQREPFLRAIDALARSGSVWVLATLRSDFYPRCEESKLLMELKSENGHYHVRPPDKEQLAQMIRLPAAAAGLQFEYKHDDGSRLDDLLRDEAARSPSSLPLLEFALDELYERCDFEKGLLLLSAYEAIGRVEGALGKRAEESFRRASKAGQAAFDRVFARLITINVTQDEPAVRRRARKDEVVVDEASRELVDVLVEDRLLVVDTTDDAVVIVSVAHEAMLKSWPFLSNWIVTHRESLKNHADVTRATADWLKNGRGGGLLRPDTLEPAKTLLQSEVLSKDEEEFVRTSWRAIAREQFRSSLRSGEAMQEESERIRISHPELRQELLAQALAADQPDTRRHAARLLGELPVEALTGRLVELVLTDDEEAVRRTASESLVQLDQDQYFAQLTEALGGDVRRRPVTRALAHVRVAADAVRKTTSFERRFAALGAWGRWLVTTKARAMRLRRGIPTLLIVLIPTLMLSCTTAGAFKFFPGLLNYHLAHARAGGTAAVFQGVLASVLWGGMITMAVTFHAIVLSNERDPRSLWRPVGALVAGAWGGMLSSFLILVVCVVVSDSQAVIDNGWTTVPLEGHLRAFSDELFLTRRYFWPYMIMGTGLGVGMAMMVNSVRSSKVWRAFLRNQKPLTGGGATWTLLGSLVRLLRPFAWPILACLAVADLLSFEVLRHAPAVSSYLPEGWHDRLLGGVGENWAAWKQSAWGQSLSIVFDSLTQAIGGFFCIVGMGLGLVAIRHGVQIEPRHN